MGSIVTNRAGLTNALRPLGLVFVMTLSIVIISNLEYFASHGISLYFVSFFNAAL